MAQIKVWTARAVVNTIAAAAFLLGLAGAGAAQTPPPSSANNSPIIVTPHVDPFCRDEVRGVNKMAGGDTANGDSALEHLVAATEDPVRRAQMVALIGEENTKKMSGVEGGTAQCEAFRQLLNALDKLPDRQ